MAVPSIQLGRFIHRNRCQRNRHLKSQTQFQIQLPRFHPFHNRPIHPQPGLKPILRSHSLPGCYHAPGYLESRPALLSHLLHQLKNHHPLVLPSNQIQPNFQPDQPIRHPLQPPNQTLQLPTRFHHCRVQPPHLKQTHAYLPEMIDF